MLSRIAHQPQALLGSAKTAHYVMSSKRPSADCVLQHLGLYMINVNKLIATGAAAAMNNSIRF